MAPQEGDPARDVDSWDPWADESQDPAPFSDRDEDQSAGSRPRRGGDRAVDRDGDATVTTPTRTASAGGVVDLGRLTGDAPAARRQTRTRSTSPSESRGRKPTGRPGSTGSSGASGAVDDHAAVEDGSASTPRRRSSSFGSPKRGSGNSSFGRPEPGAGNSSFGRRSGSGSFGKPSGGSSFGDGGSSGLGGGRGSARKRSKKQTWGIQLDAEVEEPIPVDPAVVDEAAAVAEEAADARARARAAGGGRGRAGSFDRPRRPDGEPAPESGDPEATARQLCLAALTGAARTRQQLAAMLTEREVPEDAATTVLDRFVEVGLIDDAAYAAVWVSSRQSGRGLSKRALAQELKTKGVDPEVAAVALEAVDPQDEWDTARALVARKVPSMRRLDTVTATRRLVGMLARKGYGGGLAALVVREALEADGAAEDAAAEADDSAPEIERARSDGSTSAVRVGLWSRRPLEETAEAEVGGGLTLDGVARSRWAGRHPRS